MNAVLRITPAHAGNSPYQDLPSTSCRDHPRTCGEQASYQTNGDTCRGSPPHMRGTARVAPSAKAESRITPAHAGNRLEINARRISA